jgi:hypothetical protein
MGPSGVRGSGRWPWPVCGGQALCGAGSRAVCARDPAPLRYVGVPPASRPGRASTFQAAFLSSAVGVRPGREVDRGQHDLCGCAAIPAFPPEQFSHSPTRQETGALFWGGCGDWCSGSTGHLSGRSWTASQSVSLTRLIGPGRGAGRLVDGWSRHLGVCREIQYGRTAMRVNRQQGTRVFLVLAVVLASLWTGGLAASSAANPADYLASSRAQLGIQPAALRNSAPALRPAAERPGPRGHLVPLLAALAAALAGACRWRTAAQRPGLACSGSRVCSTPLEARAPPHLQPA